MCTDDSEIRSTLVDKHICFLGAGAMAEAIIKGILAKRVVVPQNLWMVDISPERNHRLQVSYGVKAIDPSQAAAPVSRAEILVLAVKPQQLLTAASHYRRHLSSGQTLVSVLAGVSTKTIESLLPHGVEVVRAMPNTSAAVGSAATAICAGRSVIGPGLDWAEELFQSVGTVVRVAEEEMDAVTALSGSGPAYIYALAEAMEQGGVAAGLDATTARQLTVQTLLGAARMLQSATEPAAHLRRQVTSPGGTTMAGLQVLEQRHFAEMMQEAILKAAARSRVLAQQAEAASN
jgi:pyrroline-5-carboxylate reductase